jgi:plasmid replication initiation protein
MNTELKAVQANALVRSNQGNLTLTQKRVLIYLIGMIKPTDKDFEYYRVKVSDFSKMLPNKGDNETMSCMTAIDELEDKKLKIDFGSHITSTRMVLKAKYYVGQGFFDVMLDDELKPLLLNLKDQFTEVYVKHALSLTSTHAVRLYEILKSWESTGALISTPQGLREMLGIPEKYPIYSHLKARVLKPSIKQINEKTDLKIEEIEEKKLGRNVNSLTIKFKKNISIEPKKNDEKISNSLYSELESRGVLNPDHFNLLDDSWEQALKEEAEDAPAAHIITTAKRIDAEANAQKQESQKKKAQAELITSNKKFWEDNKSKYEGISATEAYLQAHNGVVIKWVDEHFCGKLNKYLKNEGQVDRELNFFVEAVKVLGRKSGVGNAIVTAIKNRIRSYSSDEIRYKGSNPELMLHNRVGRASKENPEELEFIFVEILGQNWRQEASKKLAEKGLNFR